MAMAMSMLIKLTRPDGVSVWLRGSEISRVMQPVGAASKAKTNITFSNGSQDVDEPPEDVVKLIEGADG